MSYVELNKSDKNTIQIDVNMNWANIVYDIRYEYYLLVYCTCLCVKGGHSHIVYYIVHVYRKRYSY